MKPLVALGLLWLLTAEQQAPQFRTAVDVVALDASVVDRAGRPVRDLTPADFRVTVDGKERRVVTAQFIDHLKSAGGAVVASARPDEAPPPPPVLPGRNILILFDEDSILTADGLVARKAAESLLDGLSPLDRVGVNVIPRLRSKYNLTTDRAENRKALNAWVPGEYHDPIRLHQISVREAIWIAGMDKTVLDEVALRECRPGESGCRTDIVDESRQIVKWSGARGTQMLDALKGLSQELQKLAGPKVMVLVSSGIRSPESGSSFASMAREFAAAEITLYTLFIEKSEYNLARGRPSPAALRDDDQLEQRELGNATSAVGGTFVHAIGTIEPFFQRIATELSASYLLGIEVDADDRDGRPHQVTIKVTRKDVDVHGRKQYVIPVVK